MDLIQDMSGPVLTKGRQNFDVSIVTNEQLEVVEED
jgi:hypothetical protein